MPSVLLATAGYDYTVRFFDAASGECLRSFSHAEKQVNALAISPDRNYLVAAGNPQIRLYDVNGKSADPLVTYEGHSGNVTSVGFQRDGRWMFSGSEDGSVCIWDPRASGPQREYDARAGVHSVALHPNQAELVSGDHSGALRVWDLAAGKAAAELSPEGDAPISSVSIAADASLVVAANFNGSVFCWRPRASDDYLPLKKLQAHHGYVLAARLSPDARLLATTSSDHSVKLWNCGGGADGDGAANSASVAGDGTAVAQGNPGSGGGGGPLDWSLALTLQSHTRWVWDAAFSADSSYLVTASSDCTARLWECATGASVRTYSGHSKGLTACALADEWEQPAGIDVEAQGGAGGAEAT